MHTDERITVDRKVVFMGLLPASPGPDAFVPSSKIQLLPGTAALRLVTRFPEKVQAATIVTKKVQAEERKRAVGVAAPDGPLINNRHSKIATRIEVSHWEQNMYKYVDELALVTFIQQIIACNIENRS
jgi:hypothetical protein